MRFRTSHPYRCWSRCARPALRRRNSKAASPRRSKSRCAAFPILIGIRSTDALFGRADDASNLSTAPTFSGRARRSTSGCRKSAISLPAGTDGGLAPIVTPLGEMLMFTIESETLNTQEMRSLVDWVIRPALRGLPGVADVNVLGGYVRTFEVAPSAPAMAARGITTQVLENAVISNNRNDGAGRVREGEEVLLVRSDGRIKTLDDVRNIVVATRGTSAIRVGDVADVRIGAMPRNGVVTANGEREAIWALVLGAARRQRQDRRRRRQEEIRGTQATAAGAHQHRAVLRPQRPDRESRLHGAGGAGRGGRPGGGAAGAVSRQSARRAGGLRHPAAGNADHVRHSAYRWLFRQHHVARRTRDRDRPAGRLRGRGRRERRAPDRPCRQDRRQDAHADDARGRARGRRAARVRRRHHHHGVHAADGAAGPRRPAVPSGRTDDRVRAWRRTDPGADGHAGAGRISAEVGRRHRNRGSSARCTRSTIRCSSAPWSGRSIVAGFVLGRPGCGDRRLCTDRPDLHAGDGRRHAGRVDPQVSRRSRSRKRRRPTCASSAS